MSEGEGQEKGVAAGNRAAERLSERPSPLWSSLQLHPGTDDSAASVEPTGSRPRFS
jgi:hypothetical protein